MRLPFSEAELNWLHFSLPLDRAMQNSDSALNYREWFVVLAILLLLSTIVITAKMQAFRLSPQQFAQGAPIEVNIEGHVSKPGTYSAEVGTPLSELLLAAKPLPYANLEILSSTQTVSEDCAIVIKKLEELTLFIEGACENEEIKVPLGTRLCDLKKYIKLHPNADMAFFKKKRFVKDQENVKIPLKSVDKKNE